MKTLTSWLCRFGRILAVVLAPTVVRADDIDKQHSFASVEISPVTADGGASRAVAWGDYDNDGDADLVISNNSTMRVYFYKNLNGQKFERITEGPIFEYEGRTEGVSWIDFDNDGFLDLFVARVDGPNALFRNEGGIFKLFDGGALTRDENASSDGCWSDYNNDGYLDVYVANRGGQDDALYKNIKGRVFRRIATPFRGRGGDARSCAWGDANNDGQPDLYVGNFSVSMNGRTIKANNYFYLNEGADVFESVQIGPFVNTPALTYGVSWVDFDQDGDVDLFVTNIATSDRNVLYENFGSLNFYPRDELALSRDSLGPSKGHVWGDYDNDGDLDLFVAEGTEGIRPDELPYDVKNRFYMNDGAGNFVAALTGSLVEETFVSAGAAWADYDSDGDLDIAVANWGEIGGSSRNSRENNSLYRNDSDGNWFIFKLRGQRSNRQGIGAIVEIESDAEGRKIVQRRTLLPKTGYGSFNEPIIHFGLGVLTRADKVRIVWPSGEIDRYGPIEANRIYCANEGHALKECDSEDGTAPPR